MSLLKMEYNFSFLFVLIKFSWWFSRCFDQLFSALGRKVEGFLKLTHCLLIIGNICLQIEF